MLGFTLNYGKKDENGVLWLSNQKLGSFPVLTGKMPYTDLPECSFKSLAALPIGRYWIVDRPEGSFGNRIRGALIDIGKRQIKGENTPFHSEWFGLFNAETMTDSIFISGITRNSFRLHPLNGDGSGVSEGCITFYLINDFHIVRRELLKEGKSGISNSAGKKLDAYGYIDVVNIPSFQSSLVNLPSPIFHEKDTTSPERSQYDLLTKETVCTSARKDDVLRYGEKKLTFKKQMEHEANKELKNYILERMKYPHPY